MTTEETATVDSLVEYYIKGYGDNVQATLCPKCKTHNLSVNMVKRPKPRCVLLGRKAVFRVSGKTDCPACGPIEDILVVQCPITKELYEDLAAKRKDLFYDQ